MKNKEYFNKFDKRLKELIIHYSAKDDFLDREGFADFVIFNVKPFIQNLLDKQREEIKEKVDNLYMHTNPFKKGDETNFYKNIIKELNNI